MEIQTQFKVGDFTQKKHQVDRPDRCCIYEILQVNTQTAVAGTHIYYLVRAYNAEQRFLEKDWALENQHYGDSCGYLKFREDELIPLEQKWVNLFNLKTNN